MDAYGLYELYVKAKAREQTNKFFNTLALFSAQKIGLIPQPQTVSKKTLFSPTTRWNLNRQPLRKGAFFRKPTDKKGSNRQTARL